MSRPRDGKVRTHEEIYGRQDPDAGGRSGPLLGYKVLDFTIFQAGPMAAQLLADFGADVVKVEPPGAGDPIRETAQGGYKNGASIQFFAFNRGKRSIQLDLRRESAQSVVHRLVESFDVVLENFKPGVMDRLGVGYDALKKRNPKLVYVSASGFGLEGPWSSRGSYDSICQAVSGVAYAQGHGQRPVRVGTSNSSDTMSGIMAAFAVQAALLAREKHGIGQRVDSSQLGAMLTLEGLALTDYMYRHDNAASGDTRGELYTREWKMPQPGSWYWNPYLCDYLCKDGRWISVGTSTNKQFEGFARALGRPDLVQEYKYVANRIRDRRMLEPLLKGLCSQFESDQLVQRLIEQDVPVGPHNSYEDLLDPQGVHKFREHVYANRLVVEAHGKRHFGVAANFSETKAKVQGPPPAAGEHSTQVLQESGFSEKEIEQLLAEGVVEEGYPDQPPKLPLPQQPAKPARSRM